MMKRMMMNMSMVSVFVAMGATVALAGYQPEQWNLDARRKFAEQRFGIFIHWGLYANYAQGEWYLQQGKLDEAAYSRMKDGFYPSKFDAKEWVRVFKGAGAKYVTITSRHHDGFSLWPTKVDDGYNIANTPFGRDILGELSQACDAAGLQLNFYYSLMDWHRKDYPCGTCARLTLGDQKGDYASYKKFMLGQIAELIDNYHPGNIWFDGEWEHAHHQADGSWKRTLDWDFDTIYDFIHTRKTLVANNNHQPIREKEDIQLFERDLPGDNSDAGFSANQPVTHDRPIEQCDVIQRNVWGYRIGERNFRTAEEVVAMVARAAAKDSNLLMNIGPDGSGRLPARAVEVMAEVGKWFEKNGESIYGTTAGGVSLLKSVVSTRRGNVLYLHFLDRDVNKIAFRLDGGVESSVCLACGTKVPVERTASGETVVTIRRPKDCGFDVVVKIVIDPTKKAVAKRPASPSCRPSRVPFRFGVARYSMCKRTLDEALDILREIDCHHLGLMEGSLSYDADPAAIAAYKAKCAASGVEVVSAGPLYYSTEEELRRCCEFARRYGMTYISVVPFEWNPKIAGIADPKERAKILPAREWRLESDRMMDALERCVKEYGLRAAVHNHGPDNAYLYPTAEAALKRIGNRDRRIGALVDVGYDGFCLIEFEKDFDCNETPLGESLGYYRGVADVIGAK